MKIFLGFFSVLLVLLGQSAVPVWAATGDIVINEIGAYPTSTHEWVEIWNKGSEPVDLAGWKFWEGGANHNLTVSSTDSVVAPGEYAAIAQDEAQFFFDHSGFFGSVFDSFWSVLNESGEEIGLKDSAGNFIEKFIYPSAGNFSLERRDPNLADYTAANWQEHASGNTVGAVNSNFSAASTTTSTPSPTPTPAPTPTSTPDTLWLWPFIKINEFLPNPASGAEWIELYNTATTSLDLSGGTLCDSRASSSCVIASPTSTILAGSWLTIFLSGSHLNNSGDSILLQNPAGSIVDQVVYSGVLVPSEGQSVARKIDGADTNNDSADWVITTRLTPEAVNVIVAPPSPPVAVNNSSSGGGGVAAVTVTTKTIVTTTTATVAARFATSTSPLIINELYPNPPGSDAGEFIEIKNIASSTINLTGWKIADPQTTYSLTGTLAAGALLVIERAASGIALNNTTAEIVRLYQPDGAIASEVSYESAPEDQSYSRGQDGQLHWTEEATKGEPNLIVNTDSVNLIWKIAAPFAAAINEPKTFDATGTADPRGGAISFLWNFGDGALAEGTRVTHVFATSGVFSITVFATSTQGTVGKKQLTVRAGSSAALGLGEIGISEIFVNPIGADGNEFIELYNSGSSSVPLGGWKLRNKSEKIFTIPDQTELRPRQALVFYRLVTRLALDNGGDRVALLSPYDETVDLVKFGKSIPGQSYTLVNNEWRWSAPTPERVGGGAVVGEKIFAPEEAVARSSAHSSTGEPRRALTIAAAREAGKNTWARLEGIVSAAPGAFGVTYFYLTDDSGGIQIYSAKKLFPPLAIGDRLRVSGKISLANDRPRLRIQNQNDIDILATNQTLAPLVAAIEDLSDDALGSLARLEGEITEVKTNYFYLDDGAEIIVPLKRGAGISKRDLRAGDRVAVTGILEKGARGLELWPRAASDLVAIASPAVLGEKITSGRPTAKTYGLVALGGAGVLGLGVFLRRKT